MCKLHQVFDIRHCGQHGMYCSQHSVHCGQHNVHCSQHGVHCIQHDVHCGKHGVHLGQQGVHCGQSFFSHLRGSDPKVIKITFFEGFPKLKISKI